MRRLPIFRIDQELRQSGGSSPACSTPPCCFLKFQEITTPNNCINCPFDIFMELLRTFLFLAFNYSDIWAYPHTGPALDTGLRVNPVVPVKFFNGFCGTDLPAGSADNTVFSNLIFHKPPLVRCA